MLKRKIVVGMLTAGLAFGAIGTVALAKELPSKESIQELFKDGIPSFNKMLPFMKEMHPNLSDDQLKDMYQSCHGKDGKGGMMQNPNAMPQVHKTMMNNL
ncbi:hypothetical protein ACNQFZ_13760 [Schinkia sp. CFF1]